MTTIEKLQNVFQDVFDDPSIRLGPEFSPASYADWDSVATVRLVLSIESAFDIRFSTDQVADIRSVKDILSALEPLDS
ncbi:MAG: acyl carrier protein [Thermoguttaceae bacterium]|jgi:acyl carrier protein